MKPLRKLQYILRRHDKREIFLWAFYIGFIIEMSVAALLDYSTGNWVDVYIDLFFLAMTLISFGIFYFTRNSVWGLYSLVLIATLTTYALFISSHFYSTVFFTVVPSGYFLLFAFRESFLYTLLHFVIVLGIYIYGRAHYPDSIHCMIRL